MKIAIQANPSRGKEIISLLESLGGKFKSATMELDERYCYYINSNGIIVASLITIKTKDEFKLYTLEEFEKEFPFKIGDIVLLKGLDKPYEIIALELYMYKLYYKLDNGLHYAPETLKPYKEMKEERNITLTLDKAKEWYKKGGELKEVALQAFTEKELYPLPRSWDEYCRKYKFVCLSTRHANISLKYDALIKLEQLRNCWWNGWEPEWNNCEKYVIKWDNDDLIVFTARNIRAFLVFPTREMAVEFLKCFRSLIEQAGDLI